MQEPVTMSEVLDIAQYEKVRAGFRDKVLAQKEARRLRVGDHFTFLFENHLTVLYQVQEMMRVERIVEERAIAHEVETYNELIPPKGGLTATLLIEYETPELREVHLPKLLGIEGHIRVAVGDLPPVPATFDTRQIGTDRVSSVQYLTFALTEAHRSKWLQAAQGGLLRLVIDHPHYNADASIPMAIAQALHEDFS